MENKSRIEWIPVIELAVLAFTTLGTTITLFLHSDAKMDEFRIQSDSKMDEFRREWLKETKDFHGKLERQDAEFKAHMIYLHEERNKNGK